MADSGQRLEHLPGLGFIAGLDVNYYLEKGSDLRFYMGPRIRYGVDKLLRELEGFSFQYQLGYSLWVKSRAVHHFSVGYGFVKVLNAPQSYTRNPDQLLGWFSINYRINLRW